MIAEKLAKQFKSKYNPEGSVLRKQQLIMLNILNVVADICNKNGISYWICFGTLLGAYRHSGFIPWDDDLDIMILYDDRKRFEEALLKELPDDITLQTHATDPDYYHPYFKVRDVNSRIYETSNEDINYKYRGIYIDVFLMEFSHSFLVKSTFRIWGPILYYFILQKKKDKRGIKQFVNHALYNCFSGVFYVCRKIDKLFPVKYLNHSYGAYWRAGYFIEDIFPLSKIEFEGMLFNAPRRVEKYLEKIYGDYNKFPEHIKNHIMKIDFMNNEESNIVF